MSDTERSKFLNHLVTGTRDILRLQQGLSEHNNYHEFCRLLGRLKTNYQLSELVRHARHPLYCLSPTSCCDMLSFLSKFGADLFVYSSSCWSSPMKTTGNNKLAVPSTGECG